VRAYANGCQGQIVIAAENLEAAGQGMNQLAIWVSLPLASLMAWMLGRPRPAGLRSPVRGFTAVRPGTFVEYHGQRVNRLRQSHEVLELALLGGLVVVRVG